MNLIPRKRVLDFDSLFNDFFPAAGGLPARDAGDGSLAGMRVDVHETDDTYEIHADLPGVRKEDIEVTLLNDVLTVSASKRTEAEKKKKGKVIWRERSHGAISRSFSVSPGVGEKDIRADFKDGVLTLSVPRRAEPAAPESRRIPIG